MKQRRINKVLSDAFVSLKRADKAEAIADAEWMLCDVTGLTRTELQIKGDMCLTEEQQCRFDAMMKSRLAGQPLQYILGSQSFYGYEFHVNPSVLIPRFETEELVEKAVQWATKHKATSLIDMCTGSGCIGLTVLKECPEIQGQLVDLSAEALKVAEVNAKALGLENRVRLLESDLFERVPAVKVDLILSNPPYIETEVIRGLRHEVKCEEPMMALDGGDDGLIFYRRIIRDSKTYLKEGGMLIFEIGYNQMEAVKEIFSNEGYRQIKGYQDLSGKDRIILAMR